MMQSTDSNYRELLIKLDAFIRKYYINQLIRGGIYAFTLLLGFYLAVALLESFAWFNTAVRSILFYCYLSATAIVLWRLVFIPLSKLYRLGPVISHTTAANIIGEHFSHIKDKLLNTLQLHDLADQNQDQISLIHASINQKSEELRPIPFTSAIDLSSNRKYLKFAAIPAIIFLVVLVAAPSLITDPTKRLLQHNTTFSKPAPFDFNIRNKKLQVVQFDDFTLDVKLSGKEIPQEVFIQIGENQFRLEKENIVNFHYAFRNVQSGTEFKLLADGYSSSEFTLHAVPNPVLVNFSIKLDYPSYLGKKNEELKNTGDLIIPAGTRITWNFGTQNTSSLRLRFTDTTYALANLEENKYEFQKRFLQGSQYSIRTSNKYMDSKDSMQYSIIVIPDQFPTIQVEQQQDSASYQRMYFRGLAHDDYGLSKLLFRYRFIKRDGQEVNEQPLATPITINRNSTSEQFFHYWDLSALEIKPGDELEYYFEVWDNDGVNGAKSAKTQVMQFKTPTLDEVNESTDKNNSEIKKDLDDGIKKAKDLQKDINDLAKKLTEKKQMGWEEKKKLEDILKKQNELKNKIEETKQENQLNNQQQQEFTPTDESILEKQKELEKLFENIMTPEMKKLFDELNQLLNKLDKNKVQEKLEELKLSNKDMEKELDRTLEAFKQMEVEQKLQQAIDKLDDLKNKENALKQDTEGKKENEKTGDKKNEDKKSADSKELEKKQNELSKEFEQLKDDLKQMQEKNAALQEPNQLPKTENKQNEISKEMQKSSEQLNKNNKKDAAKSEKDAADKMQEMQEQMQKTMDDMQKEEQEEDMQALRQILENLLNLSFAQEDLMGQLSKIRMDNPQYLKIPQVQKKLQDDSKIIEDSLLALSKRVPALSAIVNREISAINMNMGKAVSELAERMQSNAQIRMQYSMTSINNLALLLNESLEKMQAKAKESKKPGKGSCKKPGKGSKPSSKPGEGKPSMQTMKQMQQKLNQQLEELKKQLEKGNKPGGDKPGDKPGQKPGQKPGGQGGMGSQGKDGKGQGMMPGQQGQGMSEQLAKLAAQQEALRRQMQQMMDKIKKDGGSNPGGNIAEMMEQTEKDIVNKAITQETMKRQQDIITKLLESEKAEREREQDEQRKSNEAKNQNLSNPKQFLEYKRLKEKEMELLNTVPPSLTPYYKEKVNTYFNSVNK